MISTTIRDGVVSGVSLVYSVAACSVIYAGYTLRERIRAFLPFSEMNRWERVTHIGISALYGGLIAGVVAAPQIGIPLLCLCILYDCGITGTIALRRGAPPSDD